MVFLAGTEWTLCKLEEGLEEDAKKALVEKLAEERLVEKLDEAFRQARAAFQKTISRQAYMSFVFAHRDQKELETCRSMIQACMAEAAARMAANNKQQIKENKQGIEENKQGIEEHKQAIDSFELRIQAIEKTGNREIDNNLKTLLNPLDLDSTYVRMEDLQERHCKGTREWLFDQFKAWVEQDKSKERLFWIQGGAGVGKSCLAATLCDRFAQRVLAVHFCRHDSVELRDPLKLVRSLAFQLAMRLPDYRELLAKKFEGRKSLSELGCDDLTTCWDVLMAPLHKVECPLGKEDLGGGRAVLLIDALDESADDAAGGKKKNKLLQALADKLDSLPSWLDVVVTSRPEEDILKRLLERCGGCITCDQFVF